jgi:hypothetical protein
MADQKQPIAVVAWLSRHDPLLDQRADLARRGLHVRVIPPPFNAHLGRAGWAKAPQVFAALERLRGVPEVLHLVAPVPVVANVLRVARRQNTILIRAVMDEDDRWRGYWLRVVGVRNGRVLYEGWDDDADPN